MYRSEALSEHANERGRTVLLGCPTGINHLFFYLSMVGGGTKRNEKNYPELPVPICTMQQMYQITLFCLAQSPQQAHKCVRWECRPLRELLVASGKEMVRPSSVQFQSLPRFPAALGQSVSASLSLAFYRVTPAWSRAWWRPHVQTLSPHCMSHKTWNHYFTKCQQTSWKQTQKS